jgi:hypothetical protein
MLYQQTEQERWVIPDWIWNALARGKRGKLDESQNKAFWYSY